MAILRKLLALALLAGVVAGPAALIYAYVYLPSVDLHAGLVKRSADIAILEDKIGRMNRRLAALTSRDPETVGLWDGADPNRISLAVQAKVQALGKSSGFQLRALQPMPTRRFAEHDAVVLMAQARSGYGALVEFIHGIETSAPVLMIEKMTVRVIRQGQADGELPIVDARLELLAPTGAAGAAGTKP